MRSFTDEELSKILGSPVALYFDDELRKLKKTLLAISLIGICVSFYGISIALDSTLFGLKFNNLTNSLIINLLTVVNSYYLFRFAWMISENFLEWRLRLTGSGKASVYKGGFNLEGVDYASDERQSTLYNWWRKESLVFSKDPIDLREQINSAIISLEKDEVSNWTTIKAQLEKIVERLDRIDKTLNDNRLKFSIKRFDDYFFLFLKLQNIRLILFDILLPFLAALISIISLWKYKSLDFGLLLLFI